MSDRLAMLREKLAEAEIDVLIVSQPENRRYLSGFTGSAGVLIIGPQTAFLATDFRYYTQAAEEAPAFQLAKVGYKLTDHLADLLAAAGAKRVGFESEHLTVAELARWQEAAPDVEWVPTANLVEGLRAVKSADEIEKIRVAVQVADEAFTRVLQQLRPGITEREVAWMLRAEMHALGAEGVAFETIVAAGLNGAKPHYRPADREIPAGVPIVIDMGAVVDGYHSDMTRTVVIGEPDDMFREIYGLVLEAQEKAEAHIRAGMNGVEADALARDVIEAAGHADHFGHGLGHGVGLAVHEAPRLSFTAGEAPLEPNMVVTIEPGVYLPDWGGVRIEDIGVVREDGLEILTQTPKDLEAQLIPVS
ncbi:MAG: aminopeptidase P family protein [Chloroflexi bacterium]|nr:MAG: aminopeptidase P family protein [Chloroflexota bacterium]